jgi:hypothetical protein
MKAINDFKTKTTLWLDDDGTAQVVHLSEETVNFNAQGVAVNPATGGPITLTPDYASEFALFLRGLQSTRPGPTVTTGDREERKKLTLVNGGHCDINAGTVRKVAEASPAFPSDSQVHVHAEKDGNLRLEIAGNSCIGKVQVGLGPRDNPTFGKPSEGNELNAFGVLLPVKKGDVVTLAIHAEGGDAMWLLVTNPE